MLKVITLSFILAAASMCSPNSDFMDSVGKNVQPSSWMQTISDRTPVAKLSIPGTHDTGAYKRGGGLAITQDLTVEQQLESGIRAFDVRLRAVDNDHLEIYHGMAAQYLNFETDVLKTVVGFLKKYPSETMIISLRKEGSDINSPRGYVAILREILEKNEYQPYIVNNFSADITLGEMRGKILFVSRDHLGEPIIGSIFSGWADNTSFTRQIIGENNMQATVHVEDYYKVASLLSSSINFKIDEATKNLLLASNATSDNDWFITFTSGTGLFAYPNAVAARVNKPVADYITKNQLKSCGIVFMDFAGWDDSKALTKAIIDCNSRLSLSN